MQTSNQIKQTKTRRTIICITLLVYLAIWTFLFYAEYTVPNEEVDPPFVLGLLLISGGSFLIYFIVYLALYFDKKDSARKDYLLALIIILLPVIIGLIDYIVTIRNQV